MDKRMIAETVLKFVASSAVGVVIGNAVKSTTPEGLDTGKKVMTIIGSYIVTEFLADEGGNWVVGKFEGLLNRLGPKPEAK